MSCNANDIIQICAWCLPKIHVLNAPLAVGAARTITFELDENRRPRSAHAIVHGQVRGLKISDGICGQCSRKMLAETARVQ